jgi:hypothetical protein
MGSVRSNRVAGRDYQDVDGWVIAASVGLGSTPAHTSFTLGPLNATNVAIYKTHAARAHTSGQATWLAAMPQGFRDWYGGLASADQDGIYECFRLAGELDLDP